MTTATLDHRSTTTTTTTTGHPVRRAALVSGAAAAVATTVTAAVADAAGVPLAIDGEAIPVLGFAQMTALGAAIGGLLAAFAFRARRQAFVLVAVVLTALSCIPSVAMPDDVATRVVLVLTHVLAAAIIVPALARSIRH